MSDAYLLVSHGSRDPRPQMAVASIARQLGEWLQQTAPDALPILVETAQLELAPTPLHVQIGDFADRCQNNGTDRIVMLPLFLIPGVHVMEDIPAQVALADREIGNKVKLVVTAFLGDNPDFTNLFARNRSTLPSRSIILAHGSRRAGSNQIVERLAHDLNLQAAYWSVSPSLAERVATAIAAGATEIGILPYFLFAGGITDAIAESIAQLREQYPQVKLILGEPSGNSPELVATIGKILR
ncbi:sirohydrochlorin chelatase [Chamaesiphon sp. VAR_48_metabat_403]|uniref:sirohydrochlorin chelatase n=1 Tax=Chamaesiphon sp. VAR_48_metabat_403 TaxID=2964700 RepID=UPI00286DA24E|nr:sirohydrochlorin chelatase [Chamaesiphon sp. VAR_48_metabat_403]